ncbi:MAG: hypothetical protein UW58_C0004G0002 [Candidatus Collierbacteria bacterium GW2011_GWC2_44_30]|nr:MAG: hypothetical protein UW58_C0004G0002 [Candidatus Collierbacteria bacterium GW2011_GWC2_44_30]
MDMIKNLNNRIDQWVVETFSPIVEKMGIEKAKFIRTASLVWMIVFYGITSAIWLVLSVEYTVGIITSVSLPVGVFLMALCVLGLIGYYGYIFLDRALLDEEIKIK